MPTELLLRFFKHSVIKDNIHLLPYRCRIRGTVLRGWGCTLSISVDNQLSYGITDYLWAGTLWATHYIWSTSLELSVASMFFECQLPTPLSGLFTFILSCHFYPLFYIFHFISSLLPFWRICSLSWIFFWRGGSAGMITFSFWVTGRWDRYLTVEQGIMRKTFISMPPGGLAMT